MSQDRPASAPPAPALDADPSLHVKWIGCATGNWIKGRYGLRPLSIVLHLMDGSLPGTDAWFNTPPERRGGEGLASASHYGIGRLGEIHQYVRETDRAYHAGRVRNPTWHSIPADNPNLTTIGIEHEGRVTDTWPEAMISASCHLMADICYRWRIVPSRQTIVGHHEIYDLKACPGPHCPIDDMVRRVTDLLAVRMADESTIPPAA